MAQVGPSKTAPASRNSIQQDASHKSGSSTDTLYEEEYRPPFLPALIVAFPIMPLFWSYHVRVTTKGVGSDASGLAQLSFGYNTGMTSQTISIDNIVSAEPIHRINGFLEWGGWGLRKNLQWHTGYIAKNGPGVKVRTKIGYEPTAKETTYVFNCSSPEEVCDLIHQYQKDDDQ